MEAVQALIDSIRAEFVPDARAVVFDVETELKGSTLTLRGTASHTEAASALVERARALNGITRVIDRIVRLPAEMGDRSAALVRVALAPLYRAPSLAGPHISQYVLGHRLDVLEKRDAWLRVRGEDGYLGWTHAGYLELGTRAWAQRWERGEDGEPVVSLGAELQDDLGNTFARLPWGARIVAEAPSRLRLPDGRRGRLAAGEVVAVDRLLDRFPPRGVSVARTARRWLGIPYLWGGTTPAGVDCSGFVQSIYWMHGVALPRDSDQQARLGQTIDIDDSLDAPRAGDLLFFTEAEERITHVALSLGRAHILHSAVSNGCVDLNDLQGDRTLEQQLRSGLVAIRRLLPDS
ncbi:MAG: C40 family peptidase [Longimicrobiales bacterium]